MPVLKPARARLGLSLDPGEADLEVVLAGSPSRCYLVESSSDLQEWSSQVVNTDHTGTAWYRETPEPWGPQRFFRARVCD